MNPKKEIFYNNLANLIEKSFGNYELAKNCYEIAI